MECVSHRRLLDWPCDFHPTRGPSAMRPRSHGAWPWWSAKCRGGSGQWPRR